MREGMESLVGTKIVFCTYSSSKYIKRFKRAGSVALSKHVTHYGMVHGQAFCIIT